MDKVRISGSSQIVSAQELKSMLGWELLSTDTGHDSMIMEMRIMMALILIVSIHLVSGKPTPRKSSSYDGLCVVLQSST
jgi:hypothetical protein